MTHDDDVTTAPVLAAAPDLVEVRRNGGLAALLGGTSCAVAIGYLARAASTGSAVDWSLAMVLGLLGAFHLRAFVDARTPLLVADSQGVRIRLGRAWRGLPWGALASVQVEPRRGLLRDGRLVLEPRNAERVLAELDGAGRREGRLGAFLYGSPFALPLGLSTRVVGHDGDLAAALRGLAGSGARVVELVAGQEVVVEVVETDAAASRSFRLPSVRPRIAHTISVVSDVLKARAEARAARREERAQEQAAAEAAALEAEAAAEAARNAAPSPTPAPLRAARIPRRAELRAAVVAEPEQAPVEGRELRRPGSVDLVEEKATWGDRVRPLARIQDPVEPLVIDDFAVEPAPDPVIGPELRAARTRIGLSVDQLAERTRIRPHVIEAIEVDDFVPCGGDFYARGHLRTLSRVLGVDVAPLLTTYDERYADAPISPRRVFEAELAQGAYGGIRSTRGGPNWSVLVAAVMTVVLAWSIARLLMDDPAEVRTPSTPLVQTSPTDGAGIPNFDGAAPATVDVAPVFGGARVVVTDNAGEVAFRGWIGKGEHEAISAVPPLTVEVTGGGAVDVDVNGKAKGTVGGPGNDAKATFKIGS